MGGVQLPAIICNYTIYIFVFPFPFLVCHRINIKSTTTTNFTCADPVQVFGFPKVQNRMLSILVYYAFFPRILPWLLATCHTPGTMGKWDDLIWAGVPLGPPVSHSDPGQA